MDPEYKKSSEGKIRAFTAILALALCLALVGAMADSEGSAPPVSIINCSALYADFDLEGAVIEAWGKNTTQGNLEAFEPTVMESWEHHFNVAYTTMSSVILRVGERSSFYTVIEGGVAPYVYEYDVYYQAYGAGDRSYYGQTHEVSLSPDFSFVPHSAGRYILSVHVEDSAGNSVDYYGDAMPTATPEIEETIEEVRAAALEAGGEYETALYIHKWLIDNVEYSNTSGHYEADSALSEGLAVCSGYAEAFNTLCRACGIESISVHGYAAAQPINGREHSWNCVRLGGSWYHVDVTKDDSSGGMYGGYESPFMTTVQVTRSHCFGVVNSAGKGGDGLPPHCNATMYAQDYEADPVAESISISITGAGPEDDVAICVGCQVQINGQTSPKCSRHEAKLWDVSNEDVATIDARGLLTALSPGECDVLLSCGDLSAVRHITIIEDNKED